MKYYCSCFDDGSEPGFDAAVRCNVSIYVKLDKDGNFKYINEGAERNIHITNDDIKAIESAVTCGCCGAAKDVSPFAMNAFASSAWLRSLRNFL